MTRVCLKNFGRFDSRVGLPEGLSGEFDLPGRGLVLVVGPNGHGKSIGFGGALRYALWGTAGRWPDPLAGRTGSVRVETPGFWVERRRKSPRSSAELRWARPGQEPTEYESPTKAQAALERDLIGFDLDGWMALAQLHADTASATFTLARDADRKALVEALVPGLGRFEPALEQARARLKAARLEQSRLSQQLTGLERDQAALQGSQAGILEQLSRLQVQEPGPLEDQLGKVQPLLERVRGRLEQARQEERQLLARQPDQIRLEEEVQARSDLREALQVEADLKRIGPTCQVCRQAVPEANRSDLVGRMGFLQARAGRVLEEIQQTRDRAHQERAERLEQIRGQVQHLTGSLDQLAGRASALSGQLQAARALGAQQERLRALQADGERRLEALAGQVQAQQDQVTRLAGQVEDLELAERILGLRGLRAHLTGRTLRALEAYANQELAVLWPGVQVRLSPVEETRSGTLRETIGLELHGTRQGAVEELNRGMLRRIDLALFLARRQLARLVRPPPGWVLLDECLDSLDPDGVAACATRLGALAEQELVVVISNSERVVRGLPFTERWTVDAGLIARSR